MITFMFNIGVNPISQTIEPHEDAKYKIYLHKCDKCNHKQINFLHIPGSVVTFETKEQMLEELTRRASGLWDKATEMQASIK